MCRFLHINIHIVVGKNRTTHRCHTHRFFLYIHFLHHFHDQFVHQAMRATRAIVHGHIHHGGGFVIHHLIFFILFMAGRHGEFRCSKGQEFGGFIKEGVATDMAGMESLLPLLRFRSTQAPAGDEWVSLAGYVQRMQPEQKEIYYILGEDLTSVQRSPHLDPLKQRHIEVLTLVETVDSFMMVALREFDGKPLKNVDNADLDLPPLPEQTDEPADDAMPDADFDRLLARFTEILGDRVQGVRASKALSSSPCRLVSPEGAMNQEMQRVYKLLDQPFTAPKKVLELNRSHALVQDLAFLVTADRQADLMRLEIEQLYESALLQEGIHPNPAAQVAARFVICARTTGDM